MLRDSEACSVVCGHLETLKKLAKLIGFLTRVFLVKETNMKTLKRFSSVLVLSSVLGVSALAGETNAPPCAPGEMSSPPCAVPGEISTPPGESQSNSMILGETSGPTLSEAMIAGIATALELVLF
jgi:hypothetical protein